MLPLTPDQIKVMFRQAMALYAKGDLSGAEERYATILKAAPNLAEAHFQMSRIAARRNEFDKALKLLTRARKLKPGEPAVWKQMAEVLASKGDAAASRQFLKDAKSARVPRPLLIALQDRLAPRKGATKVSIGAANPQDIQKVVSLLRGGKEDEAVARAQKLCKAHPDLPLAANLLGAAWMRKGQVAEARKAFERALHLDPKYAEARDGLGRALMALGDLAGAEKAFRQVLKEIPDHAATMGNLGLLLCRKGETEPGIAALRHALNRDPKNRDIRLALGAQLSTGRMAAEAVEVLKEGIAQGDTRPIVYLRLAQAYTRLDDVDGAEGVFKTLAEIAPDWAEPYSVRAVYLQARGDFATAEEEFRKAIALDPGNGEHYRTFGATSKLAQDKALMAEMQARFDDPATSDESRMHFGFALARALEEAKEYDRVFTYLKPANDLMAARYPFDMEARRRTVEGTKAAFAKADMTRQIDGATDYAPIFVTGMPRSGTTLVEQILSSHSQLSGVGEVGYAVPLISKAMLTPDGNAYLPFDDMADSLIRDLGQDVAAYLKELAPDTPRVTDKSIQTYMLMGAIKLAMPKARIVLVRRDPRDVLLSIYKNFFREGTHTYAYDLKTLGEYYRLFDDMVEFWREKLPGGFHEIHYENLIAEPEAQSRALLAACDLDWEDQCLSFYENKRSVATLSVAQVRQPMYATSLKGWKRFEDELAPMIEALGDVLDKE